MRVEHWTRSWRIDEAEWWCSINDLVLKEYAKFKLRTRSMKNVSLHSHYLLWHVRKYEEWRDEFFIRYSTYLGDVSAPFIQHDHDWIVNDEWWFFYLEIYEPRGCFRAVHAVLCCRAFHCFREVREVRGLQGLIWIRGCRGIRVIRAGRWVPEYFGFSLIPNAQIRQMKVYEAMHYHRLFGSLGSASGSGFG